MLFNSHIFLLVFLPLVLAGFLLSRAEATRIWYLIGVSLVFYGYWDLRLLPLLTASVLANWLAAAAWARWRRRAILWGAILGNIACLGYYKYLGFFAEILRAVTAWEMPSTSVALPLGISFFTFHHIIYLADALRGGAPHYRFREYFLYIVLFPQILAGPLVRHSEIVHQFHLDPWRQGWPERVGRGLVLLVIGLAKKVVIADRLSPLADPLFAGAAAGQALGLTQGWTAALAFTGQIYFDFSGYSDMAIGLALLFGLSLPMNFDTPYRALSVREFWRRWHMTLSRFLRDYLYVSLGGNRHGLPREMLALMATMLLGGLWHGAGWSFVVWGGLHGLALAGGRMWSRLGRPLPWPVAWGLTLLFVVVTWVFFRAGSLAAAAQVLSAMAGIQGLGPATEGWPLIAGALAVAVVGPNSQTLALSLLRPGRWPAYGAAAALAWVLLELGGKESYEFIYFQF